MIGEDRRLRQVQLIREENEFLLIREHDEFTISDGEYRKPVHQFGLPGVEALLTAEQYRLITTEVDRPLVIRGKAGSGKSTIALYRVAFLASKAEQRNRGQPLY